MTVFSVDGNVVRVTLVNVVGSEEEDDVTKCWVRVDAAFLTAAAILVAVGCGTIMGLVVVAVVVTSSSLHWIVPIFAVVDAIGNAMAD